MIKVINTLGIHKIELQEVNGHIDEASDQIVLGFSP